MGILKSKKEKEIQKRILIKRTMSHIKKHVSHLEGQKEKYIEAAKQAKMKGATTQLNLAISGLKTAMAQQKKAEEMLLNYELALQMKDLTKMTSEFLNGMGVLSKEMSKITNKMDFAKIHNQFEKAMNDVEMQGENLDAFLESSDTSFESLSGDTSKIEDEEIARLIDIESSNEENSMDAEIDKKLEEVRKVISNS